MCDLERSSGDVVLKPTDTGNTLQSNSMRHADSIDAHAPAVK